MICVTCVDNFKNIPNKYKLNLAAIGKLSTACTATHIGQGFIITAGHCFWQTFFDAELYENQKCTDETISWAVTTGNLNPKISKCKEIIAMQKSEILNLDFAIMRIDNPPLEKIALDFNQSSVVPNTLLTLFSYPLESPLSWSKYCRIKKINLTDVNPQLLHHACDTQSGSSGAAVLNAMNGKIVGIHISSNGDPEPDGSSTKTATENYAVYISKSPIKSLLLKAGYKF